MELTEIGVIRDGYKTVEQAPRQGFLQDKLFTLEIKSEYKLATLEFEVGDLIQVVYFATGADRTMLRNRPHNRNEDRGVFSTRSPHRPNPINICIARIEEVNDKIIVSGLDALDYSPIIDIKGYSKRLHDGLIEKYK